MDTRFSKIVTVFTALFMSVTAQAQDVSFGVKAGASYGGFSHEQKKISEDKGYDTAGTIGFHVGVFAELPFQVEDCNFAIRPEIVYMHGLGSTAEKTDITLGHDGVNFIKGDLKQTVTRQAISIPVMLRWYPSKAIKGLSFEVGPQVNFVLKATREIEAHPLLANSLKKNGLRIGKQDEPQSRDVTAGINAGISYAMDNGFEINARFHEGIIKNTSVTSTETSLGFVGRDHYFTLAVGYTFN